MNLVNKFYSQDIIQFVDRDIKLWREELEGIEEEITFFKNFIATSQVRFSKEAISKKLNAKQFENTVFLSRLNSFAIKSEGMNECDDIQCEKFYFNDYVDFKLRIESFLFQYRKLKKNIFLKVNNHSKTIKSN